jgi:hypothetical protein
MVLKICNFEDLTNPTLYLNNKKKSHKGSFLEAGDGNRTHAISLEG